MALFVVRHQHQAERCPARDPEMGNMLLNHLGEPSAQQYGVAIHSEAVVDGQHTLYLIAESADRSGIDEFMKPFSMAGSVDVWQASPCAAVVERRGCSG